MKVGKSVLFFSVIFVCIASLLQAVNPIKIIDCLDREVLLTKPPERILISGRAGFMITNASFLFENAPKKLLTYSKNFQLKNSDGFYRQVDPFFAERSFTDNNTGIEEIAALKPDLVLLRDFERSHLEKPLELLGVPVLFFNLENPEVYYRDIKNLGMVYDEMDKAQKIIDFFDEWQQRVVKRLEPLKQRKRPKVLHVYYSERGGPVSFNVSPGNWIQAMLVRSAGGDPIWAETTIGNNWQKVGFDQIASWNPDFIFVTSYFGNVVKAVDALKKDKLWQLLAAVKNNKVFAFPEDYICWDQPDSRWLLGLCWLSAVLNPEVPELKSDMHKLFTDFFELYGISPERSAEIKILGDYF